MKCALIDCCFAEETKRYLVCPFVLRSKGNAGSEWYLTSNNSMSTQEVYFLAEHVHRTALALRAPGRFAVQLGHQRIRSHSFGQSMSMLAVAGQDVILFANG